jgi:hypothetical protein
VGSHLGPRGLIGKPEKRRAVRPTAAPAGGQGCRRIRALKSNSRATPPPALVAYQTARAPHSAAFFHLPLTACL